jgi:hypothetical protein
VRRCCMKRVLAGCTKFCHRAIEGLKWL